MMHAVSGSSVDRFRRAGAFGTDRDAIGECKAMSDPFSAARVFRSMLITGLVLIVVVLI